MGKTIGGQQQPSRKTDVVEETAPAVTDEEAVKRAKAKDELDDSIDSVLDEIDGVLEANAEEFVRGFVQKGGQ